MKRVSANTSSSNGLNPAEDSAAWRLQIDDIAVRYRQPLLIYFERRVGNRAIAEELAQEVFCRLLRRPDAASIDNLEAYLFRVAANLLRDKARRERVRETDRHIPLEEDMSPSAEPSQHRRLEGKQRLCVIVGALKELSPKCRSVFVLHRFEGMSHSNIAAHYGISVSAVEKHIMKALAHLRRSLED